MGANETSQCIAVVVPSKASALTDLVPVFGHWLTGDTSSCAGGTRHRLAVMGALTYQALNYTPDWGLSLSVRRQQSSRMRST